MLAAAMPLMTVPRAMAFRLFTAGFTAAAMPATFLVPAAAAAAAMPATTAAMPAAATTSTIVTAAFAATGILRPSIADQSWK